MSLTAEHRPVLSTVANTTRRTDGNDRNDALTVRTPLPPCGRVSPADAVEAAARRPVTSPGEGVICPWACDPPTPLLARACALARQAGGELVAADRGWSELPRAGHIPGRPASEQHAGRWYPRRSRYRSHR